MPEQNAKSHAAVDPLYMGILLVLTANIIVECVRAYRLRDFYTHWQILVAITLFFVASKTRTNPLKTQDRIIRLEEQVRLSRLLPEPLLSRAHAALTRDQYIGLRFASDAELPALVERTLAENLTRKQIKEAIATWRADHFRL